MPFCFGGGREKREKCKCTGCNCKQKKSRKTDNTDGGKLATATARFTSKKNNCCCSVETLSVEEDGRVMSGTNGLNGHYGTNNQIITHYAVAKDALVYASSHRNRGKAVIFNFDKFNKSVLDYEPRLGSDKDKQNLKNCLENLDFHVVTFDNLTNADFGRALCALQAEDHRENDMLLVAILTHGEHNRIATSCGTLVAVHSIWEYFEANNCPTLASKPKIFLIQACRGIKYDSGTELTRKSREKLNGDGDGTVKDATDSGSFSYVIPNAADIIVAFSCPYGYYSFRNPDKGSWFIQSFCKVMREQAYKDDFASLLTIVANDVALNYESNTYSYESNKKRQVPSTLSTLIRKIVLRPKRHSRELTRLSSVAENEDEIQEIGN